MELRRKKAAVEKLFADQADGQTRSRPKKAKTELQVAADKAASKSLNDLPTEILLEILKLIPSSDLIRNVSRVSKKFYSLTMDASLSISFRFTFRTEKFAAEAFLQKRSRQISSVVIYQVMRREALDYLAPSIAALPKLTAIKISMVGFELPKSLLGGIFEKGNLEKLVVVNLRLIPDLTGLENCSKLRHVQFDHVMQIEELKYFSDMTNLRVLVLPASTTTSLEDFVQVFEASQWSSLEELTLTFITMNSSCLEVIANKCPKLKKIWIYSIFQNSAIASSAVDLILRNCQLLRFFFMAFKSLGKTIEGMDQELSRKYLLNYFSGNLPRVTFTRK